MNFEDVEQRFGQLKQQHDAGSLSDPDFDREREQLKTQDERGVWWTKGKAGDWYFHDGSMWVPGNPQLMGRHPSGPMPAQAGGSSQYDGWSQYGGSSHHGGSSQYGYQAPYPQQAQSQGDPKNAQVGTLAGLGIGSAILSLIFLPPLFGLLGILFGFLAFRQGHRTWGVRVMIGSGVCLVVGMIIGGVIAVALQR